MDKIFQISVIQSSFHFPKKRIKRTIEFAKSLKLAKTILSNYIHDPMLYSILPVTYMIEEFNLCNQSDDILHTKANNRFFLYNENKELGYSTELMKEPILDIDYNFKHEVGELVLFLDPFDLDQLKMGIILSQPPKKEDLKDYEYKKEDISYLLICQNNLRMIEPISLWGNLISKKNIRNIFSKEEIDLFHEKILKNEFSIPLHLKNREAVISQIKSKINKFKFIDNIKKK